MKNMLAIALLVGTLGGGCVLRAHSAWTVDVSPPAPRIVTVTSRPGYAWIDGRWDYYDGRWVWHDGYWERARVGQVWAPGVWIHVGARWQWREGSWIRHSQPRPQPRPHVRDHR